MKFNYSFYSFLETDCRTETCTWHKILIFNFSLKHSTTVVCAVPFVGKLILEQVFYTNNKLIPRAMRYAKTERTQFTNM